MGKNNVKLTISYEDPSGERIEQVKEYVITGTEPVMDEGMGDGMDMPADMDAGMNGPGLSNKVKIGIGVGAAAGIIILIVVVKAVKKKKAAKLIEEDLEDDMEGKDDNERL